MIDLMILILILFSFYSVTYGIFIFVFKLFKIRKFLRNKYLVVLAFQMIYMFGFFLNIFISFWVRDIFGVGKTAIIFIFLGVITYYFIKNYLELKRDKILKPSALIFVLSLILYTGMFVIVKHFLFSPGEVGTDAMAPTHPEGDRILEKRYPYFLFNKKPNIGDIVLFEDPNDHSRELVKRCVAIENDTVFVDKGILFLNGKKREEPYASFSFGSERHDYPKYGPIKIPPGMIFVLGDNRLFSRDSRDFQKKGSGHHYPLYNCGLLNKI